LKEQTIKCNIWSIAVCGAENYLVPLVDRNYFDGYEMKCWRRIDAITLIDQVRNKRCYVESRNRRISYSKEDKTRFTGQGTS
jgi:hypothetical protein